MVLLSGVQEDPSDVPTSHFWLWLIFYLFFFLHV